MTVTERTRAVMRTVRITDVRRMPVQPVSAAGEVSVLSDAPVGTGGSEDTFSVTAAEV